MTERIAPGRVRWLWHVGYWDGPLNGIVEVDGERMWMACPDDSARRRTFFIYRLTPEQLAAEEAEHALWVELVGTHCDYVYDDEGVLQRATRFSAATHPNWHSFYEREDKLDRSDFTATDPVYVLR